MLSQERINVQRRGGDPAPHRLDGCLDAVFEVELGEDAGDVAASAQCAASCARRGSFQPGRTKWQVYPLG